MVNMLQQIECPMPPHLEEAFGISWNARWLGLMGDQSNHAPLFGSGRQQLASNITDVYILLKQPLMKTALAKAGVTPNTLGIGTIAPNYGILFDRRERKIYVTPAHNLMPFLVGQWSNIQSTPIPNCEPTDDPLGAICVYLASSMQSYGAKECNPDHICVWVGHCVYYNAWQDTWFLCSLDFPALVGDDGILEGCQSKLDPSMITGEKK